MDLRTSQGPGMICALVTTLLLLLNFRFVQLADCGHVVHAQSMDNWVEQAGEEGQVGLAECPMCKAGVRSTVRYINAVNSHLVTVERVKQKLRGEVSWKSD